MKLTPVQTRELKLRIAEDNANPGDVVPYRRFRLPSVSEAIEFRQREFGWTQTRMAKALGLTRGHYSEIMRGKRRLPYEAACRAFALGVPAAVLLNLNSIKPKRANVYGDRT